MIFDEMREKTTHPALSSTPGNHKAPFIFGGKVQFDDRLLRLVVVDERPVEDHIGAPRERKVQLVDSR